MLGLGAYGKQGIVTENLIRYYDPQIDSVTGSMVEQSGRTAAITTGNGVGYSNGDPAYYSFVNGTLGKLVVNAATDLDWTSGTVVWWSYPTANNNVQYVNVGQRSTVGVAGTRYSIHVNPSANTIGLYNGSGFNTISTTVDTDIWYQWHALLSTTANAIIYKNGTLVGTINSSAISATAANKNFDIGSGDPGYANETFTGRIGPVMIYNRRLAPQEIEQNWVAQRGRFGYPY
jgi:hypothetical protein